MVRSRIESIDETLMGKHTIHHLQQIERGLYELLDEEREQIKDGYEQGYSDGYPDNGNSGEQYYNETYGTDA
jgi:hypothetical protein